METIAITNLHASRFANAVIRYAFARCYAERYGLRVVTSDWFGRDLWGANDWLTEPGFALPMSSESRLPSGEILPPLGREFVDTDFLGYAQWRTSWYAQQKELIRGLFSYDAGELCLRSYNAVRMKMAEDKLSLVARGRPLVGMHVRLTDYGRGIYYRTPFQWYADWWRGRFDHSDRINYPLLYIASDEPLPDEWDVLPHITAESLGAPLLHGRLRNYPYLEPDLRCCGWRATDMVIDHFVLSLCDILAFGNSTYPLTAAWLSTKDQECWRSSLSEGGFERIDPWDCLPNNLQRVEDYPHLEGIGLSENEEYWC